MESKNALYFCGGVVLGVLGTIAFLWFWEDELVDDIPDRLPETSESVEVPATVDRSSLDDASFDQPDRVDYNTIVNHFYGESDESDEQAPGRITDDEFQNLASAGNYDTQEFTLYDDGILADSTSDEVISESDAFAALGPNYTARKLQRMFALGQDGGVGAIFVRNDRLYTLYEVTFDTRTYKEVTGGGD